MKSLSTLPGRHAVSYDCVYARRNSSTERNRNVMRPRQGFTSYRTVLMAVFRPQNSFNPSTAQRTARPSHTPDDHSPLRPQSGQTRYLESAGLDLQRQQWQSPGSEFEPILLRVARHSLSGGREAAVRIRSGDGGGLLYHV